MSNHDSTDFATPKTTAHHRLTRSQVITDYKAGLLTPSGAIYYLIRSAYKLGAAIRFSRSNICAQLEISQATFYRAIAQLEFANLVKFESGDEMTAIAQASNSPDHGAYSFLSELSQICESDSQSCESDSQICESHSQICESHSQPCESGSPKQRNSAITAIPQLLQLDQLNQLTTREEPTHPPVVVGELKSLGMELTENQLGQMSNFSGEQIQEAIAVVRSTKKPNDKIRLFFKALKNGYRSHLPTATAANFVDWFEKARDRGLVVASQLCGDNIVRVLMSDDRWLDLSAAMAEVDAT